MVIGHIQFAIEKNFFRVKCTENNGEKPEVSNIGPVSPM